MNIVIITINSKEIIDFINENNGTEIKISNNKFYYQIQSKDDIYYIWNDFTDNCSENDEYLYDFRSFTIQNRNYDLFMFYKPKEMIKYKHYKLVNVSNQYFINIKNRVLDMFTNNSFVSDEEKIKKLEKPIKTIKSDLLDKLPGDIYEINFIDKNFFSKFKNNICVIS